MTWGVFENSRKKRFKKITVDILVGGMGFAADVKATIVDVAMSGKAWTTVQELMGIFPTKGGGVDIWTRDKEIQTDSWDFKRTLYVLELPSKFGYGVMAYQNRTLLDSYICTHLVDKKTQMAREVELVCMAKKFDKNNQLMDILTFKGTL